MRNLQGMVTQQKTMASRISMVTVTVQKISGLSTQTRNVSTITERKTQAAYSIKTLEDVLQNFLSLIHDCFQTVVILSVATSFPVENSLSQGKLHVCG